MEIRKKKKRVNEFEGRLFKLIYFEEQKEKIKRLKNFTIPQWLLGQKLGREPSAETRFAGTLIMDL